MSDPSRLVEAIRFPPADEAVVVKGAPSAEVSVRSPADPVWMPEPVVEPAPEAVPLCERNGLVEVGTCGGTGAGAGPSGPIGAGIGGSCGSSVSGGGFGIVGSGFAGPTGFAGYIGPSGWMGSCRCAP